MLVCHLGQPSVASTKTRTREDKHSSQQWTVVGSYLSRVRIRALFYSVFGVLALRYRILRALWKYYAFLHRIGDHSDPVLAKPLT